jgi:NADPH:quinone reductase-like Zn-dependent oxidoreductase
MATPMCCAWRRSPTPSAGPRDLLIRVRAASVNPVDCKIRSGAQRALIHYRLPQITALDVSGEVIAVGSQVTRFKVR